MATSNDAFDKSSDPQRDADRKRLKQAVDGLSEHFDSVLIIVTRYEGNPVDGDQPHTLWDCEASGNNFAHDAAARRYLDLRQEDFKRRYRE